MLLGVEVMQSIILRMYNQAKEERLSVSIVLHDALIMEISIMPEKPVGKYITP